jgi:hypothetical protein
VPSRRVVAVVAVLGVVLVGGGGVIAGVVVVTRKNDATLAGRDDEEGVAPQRGVIDARAWRPTLLWQQQPAAACRLSCCPLPCCPLPCARQQPPALLGNSSQPPLHTRNTRLFSSYGSVPGPFYGRTLRGVVLENALYDFDVLQWRAGRGPATPARPCRERNGLRNAVTAPDTSRTPAKSRTTWLGLWLALNTSSTLIGVSPMTSWSAGAHRCECASPWRWARGGRSQRWSQRQSAEQHNTGLTRLLAEHTSSSACLLTCSRRGACDAQLGDLVEDEAPPLSVLHDEARATLTA